MVKKEVLEGDIFGSLLVIKEIEPIIRRNKKFRTFLFECACGNLEEIELARVNSGKKISCGCIDRRKGKIPEDIDKLFTTNQGCKIKIIEFNSAISVKVEFQDEYKATAFATMQNIREGSVSNPYHKSLMGVAFYGEPEGTYDECRNLLPIWRSMYARAGPKRSKNFLKKRARYQECSIEASWNNFANFYAWAKEQKGHDLGFELDKDILYKGNKIYSAHTCCFVPAIINTVLLINPGSRNKTPVGVRVKDRGINGDYIGVSIMDPINKKPLTKWGFESVEDAFNWYKLNKERFVKELADLYKDQIEDKVYNALMNYTVNIND